MCEATQRYMGNQCENFAIRFKGETTESSDLRVAQRLYKPRLLKSISSSKKCWNRGNLTRQTSFDRLALSSATSQMSSSGVRRGRGAPPKCRQAWAWPRRPGHVACVGAALQHSALRAVDSEVCLHLAGCSRTCRRGTKEGQLEIMSKASSKPRWSWSAERGPAPSCLDRMLPCHILNLTPSLPRDR